VITLGVVVGYLHRLKLLEASFLCNLILALVGIVLEVAYIGDVAHITHLVAQSLQVAEHKVEGDRWTSVAQVWITINSRAADIHTYTTLVEWLKCLLAASERIV
jgi:hypothetical protein